MPPPLAVLAREASASLCCPADYFLLPALASAGAAIGRSLGLGIKRHWVEHPALWTAFVGPPGTAKSAALKLATAPLKTIFHELKEAHTLEVATAKAARKAVREASKGRGAALPPEEDADPPPLRRVLVGDTTWEALAPILEKNQRGIMGMHDELSGFINGMNQYKKGGNDRDNYLSAWSGGHVLIDRKSQEGQVPIYVRATFLTITGGIQPDKLQMLPSDYDYDDGFMDRFLCGYPGLVPQFWTEDGDDDSAFEDYERALRNSGTGRSFPTAMTGPRNHAPTSSASPPRRGGAGSSGSMRCAPSSRRRASPRTCVGPGASSGSTAPGSP